MAVRVKCPFCGTQFLEEEGPLCDCAYDVQDMEQEMDRDEPLAEFKYRRNIRGYKG